MDNTVDVERPQGGRSRSWVRWVALVAVVVAVGLALLVRSFAASGDSGTELSDRLADRVVTILQEASPDEHAEHGHEFGVVCDLDPEVCSDEIRILCVADVFGFDPPAATTVDEVEAVYAHHICAELGTGFTWPHAVRASGPLAVELTDPVTVLLPSEALPGQEDAMFADRIRAVVPEAYQDQAFAHEGFTDPDLLDELEQKFEAALD